MRQILLKSPGDHCWSHGSPRLGLKQPDPSKNTFPSSSRIPRLRFFSWSHLFHITAPVTTAPQPLSLPLTSTPRLIPPATFSAGTMSSWAPRVPADAGGLTNERASASPARSALTGNGSGRLTGWQIARAGGSCSASPLWLRAQSKAGERPLCLTALALPRAPRYLADLGPAQHTVTQPAGSFAKGFSAFYEVGRWGFFLPCVHPSAKERRVAWLPKACSSRKLCEAVGGEVPFEEWWSTPLVSPPRRGTGCSNFHNMVSVTTGALEPGANLWAARGTV